jgi:hypothetical protein
MTNNELRPVERAVWEKTLKTVAFLTLSRLLAAMKKVRTILEKHSSKLAT